MPNRLIYSVGYLKLIFERVLNNVAEMQLKHSSHQLKNEDLQEFADFFDFYNRSTAKHDSTELGSMYKSGILTGCINSLDFLKTNYNVEPK